MEIRRQNRLPARLAHTWVPFVIWRIFCQPAPNYAILGSRLPIFTVTYVCLFFKVGRLPVVGQIQWLRSKPVFQEPAFQPALSEAEKRNSHGGLFRRARA